MGCVPDLEDTKTSTGLERVFSSGLWVYLSNIVNTVTGFVYWLLISKIADPSVVGLVSATIGLAGVISSLLNLGMSTGLIRLLGEYIKKDKYKSRKYFWTVFLFYESMAVSTFLIFVILYLNNIGFAEYTPIMIVLASVYVLMNLAPIFMAVFIASLRTFIYFISMLIGNILRIVVGVLLVFLGQGWIGALTGFYAMLLVVDVIGFVFSAKLFGLKPTFSRNIVRHVIEVSIPSWLPNTILILGQQLAVIILYASTGAISTGKFYIALMISNFVSGLALSIQVSLLGYISRLSDGRKRIAWNSFRIGFLLTLTLIIPLSLYSRQVLRLLGSEYQGAWLDLIILSIASLLMTFGIVIRNLSYAYDMYGNVLIIGLAASVPRLLLYIYLTPLYGSIGTSIAYFSGGIGGVIGGYIVGTKIGFYFDWKVILKSIVVTLPPSLLIYIVVLYLNIIPWYVGFIISILSEIYLLIKTGILTKDDLILLGKVLVPGRFRGTVYGVLKPLLDFLYS